MPKKGRGARIRALDGDGQASRVKAERLEIDFGDGRRLLLSFPAGGAGDLELRAQAAGGEPVITLQPAGSKLASLTVAVSHESGKKDAPARPPTLNLTVQRALGDREKALSPKKPGIRRWAQAALRRPADVTVRLVGETEGRELNRTYRGKDYATNVLTFVYGGEDSSTTMAEDAPLSGDLVLCVPVVAREAAEQGKALEAHFAHLVVHGMLHLQGYDHEAADEAERMEALETDILEGLGYANPYA